MNAIADRQKPVVVVEKVPVHFEGRNVTRYQFYRSDGYLFIGYSEGLIRELVDAHMPGSDIKYVEAPNGAVVAARENPPSSPTSDRPAGRLGGAHL